jgi:hypothetical protein
MSAADGMERATEASVSRSGSLSRCSAGAGAGCGSGCGSGCGVGYSTDSVAGGGSWEVTPLSLTSRVALPSSEKNRNWCTPYGSGCQPVCWSTTNQLNRSRRAAFSRDWTYAGHLWIEAIRVAEQQTPDASPRAARRCIPHRIGKPQVQRVTWVFPLLREYEQEANPSSSDLSTARAGGYEGRRMSARPIESVFGVPEPPSQARSDAAISDIANHRNLRAPEGGQPDGDRPVTARHEMTTPSERPAEWADDELQSIASTIQDLQSRLTLANERIASAAKVETTEVDIGRLFVEAQRFSEASLASLERQIHEILHEAEAKARQILAEATLEAQEIRSQAEEAAAASTKTARELSAAIVGFSSVNNELAKELSALNAMLVPANEESTPDNDGPGVDHSEGD